MHFFGQKKGVYLLIKEDRSQLEPTKTFQQPPIDEEAQLYQSDKKVWTFINRSYCLALSALLLVIFVLLGQAKQHDPIKAIGDAYRVNNTIILVQANQGFFKLALNLDCSIRKHSAVIPIFWVMTKETDKLFQDAGLSTYYDPLLNGTESVEGYHSTQYNSMMRLRPLLWKRFLDAGLNILWIDADVVALKDPFNALRWDADLEIQADLSNIFQDPNGATFLQNEACAGLFFLKASAGGKYIVAEMKKYLESNPNLEDQQVLNQFVLKDTGIIGTVASTDFGSSYHGGNFSVRFVHPLDWTNGHLLRKHQMIYQEGHWKVMRNGEEHDLVRLPQLLHFNSFKFKDKQAKMRQYNAWYLSKDGQCLNVFSDNLH